jgi:hypothetical protein
MGNWEEILQIIYNELGDNTGKIFEQFYLGFDVEDQYKGAVEILGRIVGPERAVDLLKGVKGKIFKK